MDRFRVPGVPPMAISKAERTFFVELGARIAELRRAQNITQIQLAAWLGVSQQTVNAYETGNRRVPVSALPELAQIFGISVDDLIGSNASRRGKRGPAPKLQQQLERISQLPKSKQKFVMEMLDTVLKQAG